jgi:hypothetical protein
LPVDMLKRNKPGEFFRSSTKKTSQHGRKKD